MNIHEYQAKQILRKYGVATLNGKMVTTPDEAEAAAKELGGALCVVKAQIHAGGRGKAGGVKLAQSPQEAKQYAAAISREAEKIGRRLAREGVIGRFALDFVVVRSSDGNWDAYAIEINLRKGGTTHPFLTLQFLTDGKYDPAEAIFTAPNGQRKFFVAGDHVKSPSYRTLTPDDLFDIVVRHGLHFDQTLQTGAVFHMMSALGECGRVGLTAVGNSHDEAKSIYERVVAVLDAESRTGSEAKRSDRVHVE